MAARHGRLARTPVSMRDPAALPGPRTAPPRAVTATIRHRATREELHTLAEALHEYDTRRENSRQRLGLNRVLDWLESFPGEHWQDRWLLSGADTDGVDWGPAGLTPAQRARLSAGLRVLIVLRAVSPSYDWLSASRMIGLYAAFRRHNQAEAFTAVGQQVLRRGGDGEHAAEALNLLTRMVIVTGRELRDLDWSDFDSYAQARRGGGRTLAAAPMAYESRHAVGGLAGSPSTMRQAKARGQLSPAELVDRYPIADKAVRDVLVYYLVERSAMLDYGSLNNLAQLLAGVFWADLEHHHPGIKSLHLSDADAQAWKQRIRTLPDGRPRRGVHTVLLAVRSFYLDLVQWSLEDPARWAAWAAPCPIGENDVRGYAKETRRRQARMQERTRALVPVLPQLVAAAEAHKVRAGRLLEAIRGLDAGQEVTIDGHSYRRAGRDGSRWRPTAMFVVGPDDTGQRFDAERYEDNAFWTWAAVEVLRRTGARIEEVLELTHLSLRQYQAPTGEAVPLLQISPSKNDHERVIPAEPDLVAVLASIIRRIRNDEGKVPLLQRYDTYERIFGPMLPHLFQRFSRQRLEVITPGHIRGLLADLARRAGITDIDGSPLTFTPHDFRRVFSTETVNGGLPIHIAAKVLGHLDLNTTQGYVAVYPEEVIRHYRQFVDVRRQRRPGEEYREPTDREWNEFRDHFSLRKVALGTCDRPYGTPCQHEHACVRCPILRLDLAQVPRLLQIEANTRERLAEAHRMKWLGEAAALEESLRHLAAKKQQAERLQTQADRGDDRVDALS